MPKISYTKLKTALHLFTHRKLCRIKKCTIQKITKKQRKELIMYIKPFTFRQYNAQKAPNVNSQKPVHKISLDETEQCLLVKDFCKSFKLPDNNYNYSRFDEKLAQKIASYKDNATKPVMDMLSKTDNEIESTAGLYLVNRIIDAGAKNVGEYYHVISKFNDSNSPNIQTMLAGVYRKTQIPDGFAPLMTMYLKNVKNPKNEKFNPDEEICGAILSYLGNKELTESLTDFLKRNNPITAINNYSN